MVSKINSKFTMEDVKIAHSLKPYLSEKKFVRQFGYLNYKISKGYTSEQIVKLYDKTINKQSN